MAELTAIIIPCFSLRLSMEYDISNEMFGLAAEMIRHSSTNVFLTGKAGTGKTTFLKYIRENSAKQMAVVAPTGVAAINAGGVTIHSFFQLPLSPFIPERNKGFAPANDAVVNPHSLLSRLKMSGEKRSLLRELELLVIDEISMVRCDVLDAIDVVLRHIRHRHAERFGGVQVLFIGDMFQLPPVIKEVEWNFLSEYYASPYFFDSNVIKEAAPVYIEFSKVYRQSEEQFIHLLNQVRNNQLDLLGESILSSRYQPGFKDEDQKDYIVLTTHNHKAREINSSELAKLPGNVFSYDAELQNDFPPTAFPADQRLELKVGAQVMFIKNDADKSKRYFNGKIGSVTELGPDKILVQCANEDTVIEVKKEKWDNIRYNLNGSTRQVEEQVLGTFTQYPLRLAWAITIHKSQGLTFDKAIIDAGNAFAPGQVYVALSRCTKLSGMVLYSKVQPRSLLIDERIVQFSRSCSTTEKLRVQLDEAKNDYQLKILLSLFDVDNEVANLKNVKKYLSENASSFNDEALTWIEGLLSKAIHLQNTEEKFSIQLSELFLQSRVHEENNALQDRLKAGAVYFVNELKMVIDLLQHSTVTTDSRVHAKEFNDSIKEIFVQCSRKKFMLQNFTGGFDGESYHRIKNSFVSPVCAVNAYAGATTRKIETAHAELYYELKKQRDAICLKRDLPVYLVAAGKTIEEMTTYLPQTMSELEQINGFGKAKLEAYGKEFVSIIREYCQKNNLSSRIKEKIPKKKRGETKKHKLDTKLESLRLYKAGNRISGIAAERGLTISTIEGHLAHYVQTGELDLEELVNPEKIKLVESVMSTEGKFNLTDLKEKLGSSVSYGEIRFVLARRAFLENQRPI